MQPKKYYIITFGCQMNKSDSERAAAVLERIGYQPAPSKEKADLILVNMCSVRQSAVDRVYGLTPKFKKLKMKKEKLKTILTGCILKNDKKKFKTRFDLILSIKNLPYLSNYLRSIGIISKTKKNSFFSKDYLKIKPLYSNKLSAFVPISNGCNNACTFCAVPYTRGSLICRNHKDILKEVRDLIKTGKKEIWLLGQNVNDYRSPIDPTIDFSTLLKKINDITGNFSIRFTSPHPKNFNDKLIQTMAESKKIAPYLNLPVQSGDDEILKKMNRSYTVKEYKSLIRKIREKIPKINLSTDVIVGFPGETKKQFNNTLSLFKEIRFDMAYISKYSPRPGTPASLMRDDVPIKEKKKREMLLRKVISKIKQENGKV